MGANWGKTYLELQTGKSRPCPPPIYNGGPDLPRQSAGALRAPGSR